MTGKEDNDNDGAMIVACDPARSLFGLGGGGESGSFGLCLSDDFQRGTTGPCDAFENDEPLCRGDDDNDDNGCQGLEDGDGKRRKRRPQIGKGGSTALFQVSGVECWGFGSPIGFGAN